MKTLWGLLTLLAAGCAAAPAAPWSAWGEHAEKVCHWITGVQVIEQTSTYIIVAPLVQCDVQQDANP